MGAAEGSASSVAVCVAICVSVCVSGVHTQPRYWFNLQVEKAAAISSGPGQRPLGLWAHGAGLQCSGRRNHWVLELLEMAVTYSIP